MSSRPVAEGTTGALKRFTRGVVVEILVVASAAAFVVLFFKPSSLLDWPGFVAFVVFSAAAEVFPVRVPDGGSVSVAFSMNFAMILLFGAGPAAVGAAVGMTVGNLWERKRFDKLIFNAAQIALAAGISGLVFEQFGGRLGGAVTLPGDLIPLGMTVITYFIINLALVSLFISAVQGVRFITVWASSVRWCVPNFMGLGSLGLLLVVIYKSSLGFYGVLLVFVPILVARYSFQQYVDIRSAHFDTIGALAATLDAKDEYTRGHSDRVARLAESIGRAMKLPESEIETIRYAGLLHDIGKIGVSEMVLNKIEKLTTDEMASIQKHSSVGAGIISEVGFLKGVGNIIKYHHEWYNGRGYPEGLRQEEIPVGARVMAVADAFDAMTSDRAYRSALSEEEAVQRLIDARGVQFDPAVVDRFVSSVRGRDAGVLPSGGRGAAS
ncbi:MAG: HD-GYP domain-containing protein [Firmicutes bacterium]|nr:HD-GYP domain-containing protein [Bacillota bacterium]